MISLRFISFIKLHHSQAPITDQDVLQQLSDQKMIENSIRRYFHQLRYTYGNMIR